MKLTTAAATAAFAGLATAKTCKQGSVPITASARNGVFNQIIPVTDIDVTNFILNNTQQGINYTETVLEGYTTVSGNYSIAYEFCVPDSAGSDGWGSWSSSSTPSTVQLLTHGIGFDRRYWDLEYDNYNYSYVSEAVDKYGYATFAWDRLGIGMSSHGNPLTEIQALLEVDALKVLTNYLRAGKIPDAPAFEKVVHVGHSFGSEHTYALTAMYPNISNGIALTGFSQNGSFVPYFGLGGNFVQANTNAALTSYVDGYFAAGDASAVQTNFFSPGDFSAEILAIATNVVGQPVTIGELLTIGGETGSLNYFPGPVLVITGQRDVPYCGGNCLNAPDGFSSLPEQALTYFPAAKNKTAVIVPGAGHGLNLEYSHPFTYESILNFFEANGAAP